MLELSDLERAEAYSSVADDLKFVFDEHDVPKQLVEIFGHLHVRKLNVFARLEADEDGMRRFLREDVGLDGGGRNRALTAIVIGCWEAAREKAKKLTEHAATAQAEGRPKELPRSAQLDLRHSLEKLLGKQSDANYPSYQYLKMRLEQLGEGELWAGSPDDVVSYETELRSGGDDFSLDFSKTGGMKLKRQRLKSEMLGEGDTEAVRHKFRIMTNHWMILRLRHPSHKALHDLQDDCWSRHVEFLLGDEILNLVSRDDTGKIIGRLSWRAFLKFEWEARHWICAEVNGGRHSVATAIKAVQNDQLLRTKFVITPLATSGAAAVSRSRPMSSWEAPLSQPVPKRRKKGGSKGKDKGDNGNKGKGKGAANNNKQWKVNLVVKWDCGVKPTTPVCFHFNKNGCDRGAQCKWSHMCAYCGATDHGTETCAAFDKFFKAHNKKG